jgi:hypothetical protein
MYWAQLWRVSYNLAPKVYLFVVVILAIQFVYKLYTALVGIGVTKRKGDFTLSI